MKIMSIPAKILTKTPFEPLDTEATPFVKVIVVELPKAIAAPVLSFIVGAFTGLTDEFAPENVSTLSPV